MATTLADLRAARGWSQQELADRLAAAGRELGGGPYRAPTSPSGICLMEQRGTANLCLIRLLSRVYTLPEDAVGQIALRTRSLSRCPRPAVDTGRGRRGRRRASTTAGSSSSGSSGTPARVPLARPVGAGHRAPAPARSTPEREEFITL